MFPITLNKYSRCLFSQPGLLKRRRKKHARLLSRFEMHFVMSYITVFRFDLAYCSLRQSVEKISRGNADSFLQTCWNSRPHVLRKSWFFASFNSVKNITFAMLD